MREKCISQINYENAWWKDSTKNLARHTSIFNYMIYAYMYIHRSDKVKVLVP